MTTPLPRLILIAGPTAGGKSSLAAGIAAALDGVVINADAMQVYRDLPILTAQPSAALKQRVQHLLYEIVDPAVAFSAGKWLLQARAALTKVWHEGKTPILVGGTGMYFQSLLKGLADIPDILPHLRQSLQADYDRDGEAALRARLAHYDAPAASLILPGDKQRLLRALEIVLATGKTQSMWQTEMPDGMLKLADIYPVLVLPPRPALYAACDQRLTAMIQAGALDEAQKILSMQLPVTLPAHKIIGLREFSRHFANTCSLNEATAMAQQATRNYAKRQVTWFRNQWANNKICFTRAPFIIENFAAPNDLAHAIAFCSKN